MAKYHTVHQYEPLCAPAAWGEEGRRFVNRLTEILDDIYRRYGRLGIRDVDAAFQGTIGDLKAGVAGAGRAVQAQGERLDEASMVRQSERVYTFQRCFILRMGSGQRANDFPPVRSLGPITKEEYLSREDRYDQQIKEKQGIDVSGKPVEEKIKIMDYRIDQFNQLVDAVYLRRGWTPNGIVKLEKLIELDMDIPELVRTVRPYLKAEGYWPTGKEYAKYETM